MRRVDRGVPVNVRDQGAAGRKAASGPPERHHQQRRRRRSHPTSQRSGTKNTLGCS